ncbi:MAG: polysaccharide biosynthesis/export family protein, partial [Bacteroidales bacterium]|nr:polysaccharide biosynthesis/export family protein [Bacteroidales bacterium]
MLKKLSTSVIVAIALSLVSVPAGAQMSDDAVIAYVKDGMATGKSQTDMAKELAARGVTKAQAERIKAKYEEEQASQNEASRVAGVQEYQRRVNEGALESTAGDIDAVSTELGENGAKRVYGRDIFTSRNLTFAPSSNLPTPSNYVLGPGDEVIIEIWGTNEATIRRTISQEGTINIPNIGLVNLNGMTIRKADAYMKKKLGQIYSVDGDNA